MCSITESCLTGSTWQELPAKLPSHDPNPVHERWWLPYLYMLISPTSSYNLASSSEPFSERTHRWLIWSTWRKSPTMVTNEDLHLPRTPPRAFFSLSLERPFHSCCQLLTAVTIAKTTPRNGISQVSTSMSVLQFWNIELPVLQDSNCFTTDSYSETMHAV